VVIIIGITSVYVSDRAPRECRPTAFGWQFHLGDAPHAGRQFDHPEFPRLDKTRPDHDAQEASNAVLRVDTAAVNLGKDFSFVQPAFDASEWRQLDLPHDWVVELPFENWR
jgi:hypothetical protein